jgi:putative flippase GtrA
VPTLNPKYKFIVFSLIGVFNTLFDIALYTVLRTVAHQSFITANVISVSAALIGSYFLNSRLTFQGKKWTAWSFIGFVAVTLVGLWVIQTAAIYVISRLLVPLPEHVWHHLGRFESVSKIFVPKLLATGVSFIWNYLWYNKVIFKDRSREENAIAALDEL